MRRLVRGALIIAAAAVAAAVWAAPAPAIENETFGMTPQPERVGGVVRTTFSIPIEVGATFEDAVRVYNRTDQTITLDLYAADVSASPGGAITVGARGALSRGVGSWIELGVEHLDLASRAEATVTFRVHVRSAAPSSTLGAIVAERAGSPRPQRLDLLVRTTPPGTPTTSARLRPLLVRSPWVIVALVVLVLAGALVGYGTWRVRRPRDRVVAPGSLEAVPPPQPSAPVLRRLGADDEEVIPSFLDADFLAETDEEAAREESAVETPPEDEIAEGPSGRRVWRAGTFPSDRLVRIEARKPAEGDLPPARRRPTRASDRGDVAPSGARRRTRTSDTSAPARSNGSGKKEGDTTRGAAAGAGRGGGRGSGRGTRAERAPARSAGGGARDSSQRARGSSQRRSSNRSGGHTARKRSSVTPPNFIPLDDL